MEIKDLVGLSKPLTRLIEVVSLGVGAVANPYLIRKNADAKAHEIRVIADAIKDVEVRHKLPATFSDGVIEVWQRPQDKIFLLDSPPIEDRIDSRLDFQERKRQANIESVTATAAYELKDENDVPESKPDEDWINRFFSAAQDVSSEEMQKLWGRILSGEIKKPGSFSLKTLDFLRNMTKSDAEAFEHMAKFALRLKRSSMVAIIDKMWLKESKQVFDEHLFILAELGLMYPTELAIKIFNNNALLSEFFIAGKSILLVERSNLKGSVQLPAWKFTMVGSELLTLASNQCDLEYLEWVARHLIKKGNDVYIAENFETLTDGTIRYSSKRKVTP